jgi:hypothetical protein
MQLNRVIAVAALVMSIPNRTSGAAQDSFFHMKLIKVQDQHGFERPIPAISMLIPTDWKYQGNILWGQVSGCTADMVRANFQATSGDGRLTMEAFPWFSWQWADDPMMQRSLAATNQQSMALGRKSCDVMPPMPAADLLRRVILPKYRPGDGGQCLHRSSDANGFSDGRNAHIQRL